MSSVRTRVRNDILWIILDNVPHNALNTAMLLRLAEILRSAQQQTLNLVVLTGMGEEAFCSGFDLPVDSMELQKLHQAARSVDEAFQQLAQQGIPSVALIKGHAYGPGSELAALCDTLIAREDVTLRLPAENARLFPSATSQRFPSLLKPEIFERLAKSGETLSAHAALEAGLVHQVLPAARFLQESEELLVMLSIVGLTA
ncbi:enoyl-CoA hydratase/isomerase family protein [Ktedonobacter racemifer]|uniref:Enoyl-CoA hydratase/isomerase n=1 Tax=Ktedonobacter racemifer DSM 44963 TaxID=485913 RepID=D6TFV7_KTERA|nr:enoyl-CoA hydratase/isomerase family protein [Ktedonobacter racemifer]EFH90590.1 Enoyl-CoA hydratase/isomerase [Ktedonobacter racemifer DSM 44963]